MSCGCGRSPTGKCVGWHKLTEEEYKQKLREYESKKAEKPEAAQWITVYQTIPCGVAFLKI